MKSSLTTILLQANTEEKKGDNICDRRPIKMYRYESKL